jgi:undecaprenyl-diphosphatase
MNWLDSILIGLAQALALAPGISRSGSTIATGLGRGIRRDLAARFSFLLGTPIIFGAGLLQLVEVLSSDASKFTNQWVPIVVGFIAAAVAGTFAITFLLRYLRSHSLYVFSVYCVLLGLATIVWSFVR